MLSTVKYDISKDDFEGFMSIVNSRSKFPSLFEKVKFDGFVEQFSFNLQDISVLLFLCPHF